MGEPPVHASGWGQGEGRRGVPWWVSLPYMHASGWGWGEGRRVSLLCMHASGWGQGEGGRRQSPPLSPHHTMIVILNESFYGMLERQNGNMVTIII